MKDIILAFIGGLAVGAIFKLLKLPLPAPAALSGVVGIFGLFAGYKLLGLLINYFIK